MKEHNYNNQHRHHGKSYTRKRGGFIGNILSAFIVVLIGATLLPYVSSAIRRT